MGFRRRSVNGRGLDGDLARRARHHRSGARQAGALDSIGSGNGRSVRWNLHKLVGEYARHNGHADIVRERIDGSTGE